MRRRVSGGEYESTWQEIPSEYIKKWGTITYSVDDVLPNFYKFSGISFECLNQDGFLSDVTEEKSFFYQALTRYHTMVKMEAGYVGDDGTEYPTNSTLFTGLLSEDMPYKENNIINFNTKHLSVIFQEFPSDRITGLSSSLTASEIITKIKDYTDSNSIAVFQKYISNTAWTIQTTTGYYNMATTTSLQGLSCWDLMTKLATAEQYVMYVDKDGSFYFQDNTDVASTSVFHFSGLNDTDKTYGHNIMQNISTDENIRKVYNRVKVQYDRKDTTTSFYIKNEAWDWGDSSSSFLYGVREYNYKNEWLSTATAQTIADNIYDEFKFPSDEIKLKAKFVPQLMVQDRVDITYSTQQYTGDDLWGHFLYGEGIWGERAGYNINLEGQEAKIVNLSHNLDNFSSNVVLRALED
jgi:hypothetical protein